MSWPLSPVERLPSFRPPFCPRRDCPEHTRTESGYRARRHGTYTNRRGSAVPRFRCSTCRRTFSRQAFSPAYYLKRPSCFVPVAAGLVAGSAHRQTARMLGCAPSTVTRLAPRIGRHAMLLLHQARRRLAGNLFEPVVLDHFETFEFTQDLPFGVATPVGQHSWFVYGLDPAPHRRTGRRSPAQQLRLRARPARARRGGYRGSTRRILERLLPLASGELRVVSDDHPSYAQTIRMHFAPGRICHEIHSNPERGPKGSPRSRQAMTRDRAMFALDLLHGLIRHSQAAHHRQTIAFGRRLNALMLRLYGFAIWRNFVKRRSERRAGSITPAMRIGLTDRPWSWRQALARRRFPDRERLDGIDRELYEQRWSTPVLPVNAPHRLRFAY